MAHAVGQAGHAEEHGEHSHPGERVYIKIAGILAVITAIEVAIYYFDMSRSLLVTLLIIFSIIKFVTVVGYFMHLKFDDRRLTWIFLGGLLMAFAVFIALDILQDSHPIDYAQDILVVEEHADAAE